MPGPYLLKLGPFDESTKDRLNDILNDINIRLGDLEATGRVQDVTIVFNSTQPFAFGTNGRKEVIGNVKAFGFTPKGVFTVRCVDNATGLAPTTFPFVDWKITQGGDVVVTQIAGGALPANTKYTMTLRCTA